MKKLSSLFISSAIIVSAAAQDNTTSALVVTLKNGTTIEYVLSDIDHLTFRSDISNDPSVNIAINITQITVNSIKATFTADNSDATFLFGLIEKAEFDKLGNDKAFLEYELGRLNSEVANDPWSNTLEEYLDFLLGWWDPADQVLNRDNLKADTDYYIYAYGINTKGEFTTGLFKQLIHTAGLIDIAFNLQASGITSTNQ